MKNLKKGKAAKPIISHKQIIEITRPAYLYGLWGGAITFAVSLFLLWGLLNSANILWNISFFGAAIFIQFCASMLMLLSVYFLRKEHHCFGGSVMLLCSSIVGLNLAAGLLIGPVLGIIGGILGLSEHEKLIKHHLG